MHIYSFTLSFHELFSLHIYYPPIRILYQLWALSCHSTIFLNGLQVIECNNLPIHEKCVLKLLQEFQMILESYTPLSPKNEKGGLLPFPSFRTSIKHGGKKERQNERVIEKLTPKLRHWGRIKGNNRHFTECTWHRNDARSKKSHPSNSRWRNCKNAQKEGGEGEESILINNCNSNAKNLLLHSSVPQFMLPALHFTYRPISRPVPYPPFLNERHDKAPLFLSALLNFDRISTHWTSSHLGRKKSMSLLMIFFQRAKCFYFYFPIDFHCVFQ